MHFTIIAGARPNFMKISPIIKSIKRFNEKGNTIHYSLVHTGQHYDSKMSDLFFEELSIPKPDINLGVGSGTQGSQTGKIIEKLEEYLLKNPTDLVIVVGDITSTMAATIAAKKLNIKVAHVEAGLRSFDMNMPEEINRLITDSICDYFFTTTEIANKNLLKMGKEMKDIFWVGNTMIDTLIEQQSFLKKPVFFDDKGLKPGNYFTLTLHRPSNVDDPEMLKSFLQEICNSCTAYNVVFPMHPRTKKVFSDLNLHFENLIIVEPLSYLEFIYLLKNSKGVITDSGGIQEETTYMGIPCLTLRDNTERPETCIEGTNLLIGTDPKLIKENITKILSNNWKKGGIPYLWDGRTSDRIVEKLIELLISI